MVGACGHDASLGVSYASQAYIRKMQWLRHRRPSMRPGAPQAQLRFSSWEVGFSSHCSCASGMGAAVCAAVCTRSSVHARTLVKPAGTAETMPAWAAQT